MPETPWTPDREAAAQARCTAATEGPWGRDVWYVTAELKDGRPGGEVMVRCAASTNKHQDNERDIRNARFIAHARTDLPDAIREIQRLREELSDAWEHKEFQCPCSYLARGGRVQTPAPLEECTCGLNEALWGGDET